jgi:hypothetical protein
VPYRHFARLQELHNFIEQALGHGVFGHRRVRESFESNFLSLH